MGDITPDFITPEIKGIYSSIQNQFVTIFK